MGHWSHMWEVDDLQGRVCSDCLVASGEKGTWSWCSALPRGETRGMPFDQALAAMRDGATVVRIGWRHLVRAIGIQSTKAHLRGEPQDVDYFYSIPVDGQGFTFGVWIPSQGDLLATDWVEVEL